MEHRMERPNQPTEESQSSSPEVPSALLQEQRLFRRIMWLTLLLGIMLGITLTLFVEVGYILAGYIPHAFYPTSPIIYRLLSPLMTISLGFTYILQRRLQRLRKQHPTFQPGRFDFFTNSQESSSSLSFGLFFIWIGGLEVLMLLLDSSSFLENPILLIWIIAGVIGLITILLIPFLKSRRTAKL